MRDKNTSLIFKKKFTTILLNLWFITQPLIIHTLKFTVLFIVKHTITLLPPKKKGIIIHADYDF